MPKQTTATLEDFLAAYRELAALGKRATPSTIRDRLRAHRDIGVGENTVLRLTLAAGWSYDERTKLLTPPDPSVQPLERETAPPQAPKDPPAPSYHLEREERAKTADSDYWKRAYDNLKREYDKALEQSAFEEYLAKEFIQLAPKSYDPLGKPPARPAYGKSSPESYVLLVSDWHIGEVTSHEQTLGFGEYNPQVALDRLAYLEESVANIIVDHTISPVEELVVVFAGDMIDGALSHGNEAAQLMTVYDQCHQGSHALAQFLRNLSTIVPKLRVYSVVGNHGRYQSQKKMPTINRYSNFDGFLYLTTKALIRDVPNIEWELNKQPFQVFEVQGQVIHAGHGDNLKGGDKALGVPSHAVGRMINTNTQLFYRAQRKAPNIFALADKHRKMELPHFNGEVIFNGAFTDVNNYVLSSNFAPTEPMQVLFRVHPKHGKTASYNVKLKHARPHMGRAYLEGLQ